MTLPAALMFGMPSNLPVDAKIDIYVLFNIYLYV